MWTWSQAWVHVLTPTPLTPRSLFYIYLPVSHFHSGLWYRSRKPTIQHSNRNACFIAAKLSIRTQAMGSFIIKLRLVQPCVCVCLCVGWGVGGEARPTKYRVLSPPNVWWVCLNWILKALYWKHTICDHHVMLLTVPASGNTESMCVMDAMLGPTEPVWGTAPLLSAPHGIVLVHCNPDQY